MLELDKSLVAIGSTKGVYVRVTKEQKLQAIRPKYQETGVYSISTIERLHVGHFFSKDTMRFFGSRLVDEVFPSEKTYDGKGREFSVRRFNLATKDIITVTSGISTRTRALTEALSCAYDMLESEGR